MCPLKNGLFFDTYNQSWDRRQRQIQHGACLSQQILSKRANVRPSLSLNNQCVCLRKSRLSQQITLPCLSATHLSLSLSATHVYYSCVSISQTHVRDTINPQLFTCILCKQGRPDGTNGLHMYALCPRHFQPTGAVAPFALPSPPTLTTPTATVAADAQKYIYPLVHGKPKYSVRTIPTGAI